MAFQAFTCDERSNRLEHLQAFLAIGISLEKRLRHSGDKVKRDMRNNGEDLVEIALYHIAHSILTDKIAGIRFVSLIKNFVD